MKEAVFQTANEIWSPSVQLRWVVRYSKELENIEKVLQQLHTNTKGVRKWIDIPFVSE